MRALALILALVVALFVFVLVVMAVAAAGQRQQVRQRRRARWGMRHYGDRHRGETVVAVSLTLPSGRVLDEHVVARISDAAGDWTERFMLAKEQAEERAFHLNAGGNELPPA
jgi:pyridoxamine 5'-phosphate oxidase family protein